MHAWISKQSKFYLYSEYDKHTMIAPMSYFHWLYLLGSNCNNNFPSPNLLLLSAKQRDTGYHFLKSFDITRPEFEPAAFQLQDGHSITMPTALVETVVVLCCSPWKDRGGEQRHPGCAAETEGNTLCVRAFSPVCHLVFPLHLLVLMEVTESKQANI